jgi:hypothetical protein
MTIDRITKVLLAAIVVGVWALVMTQLADPVSDAHAGVPLASPDQAEASAGTRSSPRSAVPPSRLGSSTLPLRWRVRHVVLDESASTDCIPIIFVSNLGPSSATVDVEWFDKYAGSKDLHTDTLGPGVGQTWTLYITGSSTFSAPFLTNNWRPTDIGFEGSAQVHSNEARIAVDAFLRCDTLPVDVNPSIITNLPADPVGVTMDFFQAGMPAGWTPATTHLAEPEVPGPQQSPW